MKQDLKILIGIIILLAIGYVGYNYYTNTYAVKDYTILPEFTLKDLNGDSFTSENIPTDKVKVIIYYNGECEHCQHQAKQIQESIDSFNDVQLFFISYQETELIKEFATSYDFLERPNITFLEDKRLDLISTFTIKGFPFILVYSAENKLIEKFEGPTDISKIVSVID